MTYDAAETSRELGEPYQLLYFRSGDTAYRYTTADHVIIYLGADYLPTNPMQSVEVTETNVDDKGKLNFTVMKDHEIAKLFTKGTPRTVSLTVYSGHESDVDDEVIPIWSGRVVACEWDEDDRAEVSCESVTTVLQRMGLPYKFGTTCQHTLFRGGCKLNLFANSYLKNVASYSGYTVTIPSLIGGPDNEYSGGVIIAKGVDYRMITGYDTLTGVFTLLRPFEDLSDGELVRVSKGCDRTSARCAELGNFDHFLGFETIPTRNPFEGLRQVGVTLANTETPSGFLGE